VQNGNETNYREREKCKQTQGIMQCEPTEERGREAEKKGHKKKQPSMNLEARPTTHATTKN
jgi:hypothetical protein